MQVLCRNSAAMSERARSKQSMKGLLRAMRSVRYDLRPRLCDPSLLAALKDTSKITGDHAWRYAVMKEAARARRR